MLNISRLPYLVVSDGNGNVFEIPELRMAGMALTKYVTPQLDELIPLPEGSDLFELPNRKPIGYDPHSKSFVELEEYEDAKIYAAAAFMAPAYVQLYRSGYITKPGAQRLSLYAYTAVGWRNNKFFVAGKRIDDDTRQDFRHFDFQILENSAQLLMNKFPNNRLIHHLMENCVLRYGCPAARNLAMSRWECPVPTSPTCNADCVGCISKQPKETGVCASQNRLNFVPTVAEIVEFTVPHLENAPRAVISFGQGCEGEPLMVSETIEAAIKEIRKRTNRGIINLNTNASLPDRVERLFAAGLDSIRVSMNSAQKYYYERYHRPKNYVFEDVIESLRICQKHNRWSSLNYFIFPGFTDHRVEIAALENILSEIKISLIQARNLNIDPEWYMNELALDELSNEFIGVKKWIDLFQKKYPNMRFGYFNPSREIIKKDSTQF